MKEKKSCISAFLSFLLVFAAIASIAYLLYKKIVKQKLAAAEDGELLEEEETSDTEVEDLADIESDEEA